LASKTTAACVGLYCMIRLRSMLRTPYIAPVGSLQLRYTPGKVVFNGQEMSEEEFMSRAGRFVH
jgi:hypothetical protein